MATMITDECINCGACVPAWPNDAISEGPESYRIDPDLCTECVGFHGYEACQAVCTVECCIPDPNNLESEDVLFARAKALHPDRMAGLVLSSTTSRFRTRPTAARHPPAGCKLASEP